MAYIYEIILIYSSSPIVYGQLSSRPIKRAEEVFIQQLVRTNKRVNKEKGLLMMEIMIRKVRIFSRNDFLENFGCIIFASTIGFRGGGRLGCGKSTRTYI